VTGDYVANVQAMLQQEFGDVTVENRSVSATTLRDALTGANGYGAPLAAYLATSNASWVLENYGINDLRTETPDSYRALLVQFIETVRATGKIPVLEEPNPLCHPATAPQNIEETDANGQTMAAYVDVIDEVAAQYGIPLVRQYKPILALPNWCALISDGWAHPSPQLYQIKAANEAAVLGPLVKQLQ
jgi:lysophospholipase L1-like esterase